MASTTSLSERCSPTTPFLAQFSQIFEVCIPTPLALVSSLLGICSIVAWLFAQLPQIWTNYKLKSASGLSLYFLLEWLAGDLTNLLGAVFTRQASWQIVVAGYYVFVDVALSLQFAYFSYYKSWGKSRARVTTIDGEGFSSDEDPDGFHQTAKNMPGSKHMPSKDASPKPILSSDARSQYHSHQRPRDHFDSVDSEKGMALSLPGALSVGVGFNRALVAPMLFTAAAQARPVGLLATTSSRFKAKDAMVNPLEAAGRILSWTSTLLYLGSRLPQIYKNYIRKSTAGLAPQLFIAAFFGNLFYSSSIATNPIMWASYPAYGLHGWIGPEGSDHGTAVRLAAPFFFGAAGVLALDGYIGAQFLMYGEGLEGSKIIVVEDERGRSRWQSVSGWMRGWIPSPSPGSIPDRAVEDERPLLGRVDSPGGPDHRYGST